MYMKTEAAFAAQHAFQGYIEQGNPEKLRDDFKKG